MTKKLSLIQSRHRWLYSILKLLRVLTFEKKKKQLRNISFFNICICICIILYLYWCSKVDLCNTVQERSEMNEILEDLCRQLETTKEKDARRQVPSRPPVLYRVCWKKWWKMTKNYVLSNKIGPKLFRYKAYAS